MSVEAGEEEEEREVDHGREDAGGQPEAVASGQVEESDREERHEQEHKLNDLSNCDVPLREDEEEEDLS